MNITLFNEITTEEYLTELEKESAKYTGLYVDMENAPERKYVKEKASLVSGLIKKIDRARIDKSWDFKVKVDNEAASIVQRLEQANKPFTLLIDEHAAARKKVLDEKKAIEDAKSLIIEIDNCHDEALLINKVFAFERAEEVRLQQERDDAIRAEAAEQASKQAEMEAEQKYQRIERERLQKEASEKAAIQARENDTNHKREVNRGIVSALTRHGIEEELAKSIVRNMAKGEIPNVQINY